MVRIRHTGGYETLYLHLMQVGVRAGEHVDQNQVIGRVGSTGLSTGPHLDFRVMQHGRFINPAKVIFPPSPPVPASEFARFVAVRDPFLERLGLPLPGPGRGPTYCNRVKSESKRRRGLPILLWFADSARKLARMLPDRFRPPTDGWQGMQLPLPNAAREYMKKPNRIALAWKRLTGSREAASFHDFVTFFASRALAILEPEERKAFMEVEIRRALDLRRVEIMVRPEGAERFTSESTRVRGTIGRVAWHTGRQWRVLSQRNGRAAARSLRDPARRCRRPTLFRSGSAV